MSWKKATKYKIFYAEKYVDLTSSLDEFEVAHGAPPKELRES
jgi:hypothetical protein